MATTQAYKSKIAFSDEAPRSARRAYARFALALDESGEKRRSLDANSAYAKQVQLQKEYVVSGAIPFGNTARALGYRTDDSRDLTPQTYEEMLKDPDVAAAYWFLVYSILADKLTIRSAVQEETEEDYELAQEIKDFIEFCVSSLETPLDETLEELCEALAYGNKIAEKVHRFEEWEGETRIVIDRIKVKTRESISFVVDKFSNVVGMLATRNVESGATNIAGTQMIASTENILPRDKFVVFAVRKKDSDPRGRSMFRAAFNGWNFKKQVYPEYLLWLLNCAVPGMIGFTSEDAQDEYKRDSEGNIVRGDDESPEYWTPEEAMLDSLSKIRNSFSAVFPAGSSVQQVEVQGEGAPFQNAIEVAGQEITKAILFQTLATREGKHQTRASTSTQMTIIDILVWSLKGALCNVIKNDIFKQLVKYNYGDDAAKRLTPTCTLGDTERRDWALDAKAVADLAPFLTPTQLAAVIAQLGLPEAEPDEDRIGHSTSDQPSQEFDENGNPIESVEEEETDEEKEKRLQTKQPGTEEGIVPSNSKRTTAKTNTKSKRFSLIPKVKKVFVRSSQKSKNESKKAA